MRDRGWRRITRARKIHHKKHIVRGCYGSNWYKYDDQYSKGKIHCSCKMCRCRDYFGNHILTRQEKRKIDEMKFQMEEQENGER